MTGPITSSYCSGGDCVAAKLTDLAMVRVFDTHDPDETLVFTPEEWSAFLAGVKAGEFDHLAPETP